MSSVTQPEGPTPIFAICGYSGSGKTTLILDLVARLRARKLSVLVLKHDAHGLDLDELGKDSDRFFRAGADVLAHDARQTFVRTGGNHQAALPKLLDPLGRNYDLILIEGLKDTQFARKLWLRRHPRDTAPKNARPVAIDLGRDADRGAVAEQWIERELLAFQASRPLFAGILLGGRSSRMGRPKQLLLHRGRTWLARVASAAATLVDDVVLLGSGPLPRSRTNLTRLPDVPYRAGPVAGMCAAMRWNPFAHWLFLPCDMPLLTREALAWLKQQVKPGVWAVQPRLWARGEPQPFPGWYDARVADALESAPGPSWLGRHLRTNSPVVPDELVGALLSCNTPRERRRLLKT